ncbi:MAG TPA: hypothetical protein VEL47_03725, partial [Myxococcota bacterium]|nr:hypothetical protein [Myxococcota bacterium]
GEMLHDAIAQQKNEKITNASVNLELDKALERLTQSKNSLNELLATLEKYQASPWWNTSKLC